MCDRPVCGDGRQLIVFFFLYSRQLPEFKTQHLRFRSNCKSFLTPGVHSAISCVRYRQQAIEKLRMSPIDVIDILTNRIKWLCELEGITQSAGYQI